MRTNIVIWQIDSNFHELKAIKSLLDWQGLSYSVEDVDNTTILRISGGKNFGFHITAEHEHLYGYKDVYTFIDKNGYWRV